MEGKRTKASAMTLLIVAVAQMAEAMGWLPHISEDMLRAVADAAIAGGLLGVWLKVDRDTTETIAVVSEKETK